MIKRLTQCKSEHVVMHYFLRFSNTHAGTCISNSHTAQMSFTNQKFAVKNSQAI